MRKQNWQALAWQPIINAGMAVLLAMCCELFFSFWNVTFTNGWILISAFFTAQVATGSPFRQGFIYALAIVAALLCAAALRLIEIVYWQYAVIIVIYVGISYWLLLKRRFSNVRHFLGIVFLLSLLIAYCQEITYFPRYEIVSAILGALLAIISAFVFPVSVEKRLRHDILPILTSLQHALRAIIATTDEPNKIVQQNNRNIQAVLLTENTYPTWVYAAGFNPGLRAGTRNFLLNIERIIDLFYAIEHCLAQSVFANLPENLVPLIKNSLTNNGELVQALADYFQQGQSQETQADFTSDIDTLENAVRNMMPAEVEWLSISPHHVALAALVRDIKDMREVLLKLLLSLPRLSA